MKNKNIFLCVILLILFLGCKTVNRDIKRIHLCNAVGQLSDSTFFGTISDIKKNNGKIYALDRNTKRVIILDDSLILLNSIGGSGRGPGELISPKRLALEGNDIWVFDGSNLRFSSFCEDGGVNRMITADDPLTEMCGFFVKNKNIYYRSPRSEYMFSIYDCQSDSINFYQKRGDESVELANFAYSEKYHIGFNVSQNLPIIEVYNDKDLLIQKVELPKDWFNRLKFNPETVKSSSKNASVLLFTSICVDYDYLYLLYIDHSMDFKNVFQNKIIGFKISEKGILDIEEHVDIQLNGNWYSSFCVSGNEIYAFDVESGKLENYLIIEHEN